MHRNKVRFSLDKGAEKWHKLRDSGRLFLGIDHTALVVSDAESSLKFDREVPGMRVAEDEKLRD